MSRAERRLVQLILWVEQAVEDHLERIALRDGLSLSAAGAAFLHCALQRDIDLAYTATLEPIFQKGIARQMRGIATRLSWLLVRVAYDSGQTRSIVTNILGRQSGMTPEDLNKILSRSAESSKANIKRRTPQIEELIDSVEEWLLEGDEQQRAGGERAQKIENKEK